MTVEFTGRDLAEAIAAAAGALNLPPEKLKFSVVAMGAKGFLGLGRRRARIAVDPADPTLYPAEEDESPPPGRPGRGNAPPAAEKNTPRGRASRPAPPGTVAPDPAGGRGNPGGQPYG